MRKFILVDIDHTLSNASWRDVLIGGPEGWDHYHAQSVHDAAHQEAITFVNALASQYTIIGITARPEKWRTITQRWLYKNSANVGMILMRPDDAFHPAPQIKWDLAEKAFNFPDQGSVNNIAFIIEDRTDVCDFFFGKGISSLQIRNAK